MEDAALFYRMLRPQLGSGCHVPSRQVKRLAQKEKTRERSPSVAWIVAIVGLSSSSNELHISGKLKIMKTLLRYKCRVRFGIQWKCRSPFLPTRAKWYADSLAARRGDFTCRP